MNSNDFVEAIRRVVLISSNNAVKSVLAKPPGRKPAENLVNLSIWYDSLKDDELTMVNALIEEAVRTSVFGFLCVLDGVRGMGSEYKGELELYYIEDDQKVLLNDPNKPGLHESI